MAIGIILLAVMLFGGLFSYRTEKKLWNNGISAKSGIPWKSFDMNSQGGRGYTDGIDYIWISYSWVDNRYVHRTLKYEDDSV